MGVSTSNPTNITFSARVEKVDQFLVGLDENVTVDVSASEPRYFKFEFPEGVSNVLLTVSSTNDVCTSVSIQNLTVSY